MYRGYPQECYDWIDKSKKPYVRRWHCEICHAKDGPHTEKHGDQYLKSIKARMHECLRQVFDVLRELTNSCCTFSNKANKDDKLVNIHDWIAEYPNTGYQRSKECKKKQRAAIYISSIYTPKMEGEIEPLQIEIARRGTFPTYLDRNYKEEENKKFERNQRLLNRICKHVKVKERNDKYVKWDEKLGTNHEQAVKDFLSTESANYLVIRDNVRHLASLHTEPILIERMKRWIQDDIDKYRDAEPKLRRIFLYSHLSPHANDDFSAGGKLGWIKGKAIESCTKEIMKLLIWCHNEQKVKAKIYVGFDFWYTKDSKEEFATSKEDLVNREWTSDDLRLWCSRIIGQVNSFESDDDKKIIKNYLLFFKLNTYPKAGPKDEQNMDWENIPC